MTDVKKLTAWHYSNVGKKEQPLGSNIISFNTKYWGREVSGDKYPWCMSYQCMGFKENNLGHLFMDGKVTARCTVLLEWAQTHNQFVTDNYKEGDIFLYDSDGNICDSEHCGYYTGERDTSGKFIAIEGNYSDSVAIVHRKATEIIGAFRPKYDEEMLTTPEQLPICFYGEISTAVLSLQTLLKSKGYALPKYGADGEWGDETQMALDALRSKYGLPTGQLTTRDNDWYILVS